MAHNRLARGHSQGSWAVQVSVCLSALALPPGIASVPVHLQPVTFLNAAIPSLHMQDAALLETKKDDRASLGGHT